jgi:hypothetical protein
MCFVEQNNNECSGPILYYDFLTVTQNHELIDPNVALTMSKCFYEQKLNNLEQRSPTTHYSSVESV